MQRMACLGRILGGFFQLLLQGLKAPGVLSSSRKLAGERSLQLIPLPAKQRRFLLQPSRGLLCHVQRVVGILLEAGLHGCKAHVTVETRITYPVRHACIVVCLRIASTYQNVKRGILAGEGQMAVPIALPRLHSVLPMRRIAPLAWQSLRRRYRQFRASPLWKMCHGTAGDEHEYHDRLCWMSSMVVRGRHTYVGVNW